MKNNVTSIYCDLEKCKKKKESHEKIGFITLALCLVEFISILLGSWFGFLILEENPSFPFSLFFVLCCFLPSIGYLIGRILEESFNVEDEENEVYSD